MKRLFHIILPLLLLPFGIAGLGCGDEAHPHSVMDLRQASPSITLDRREWTQLPGESVELQTGGQLRLAGITENSRCPADAFCVWQGRIVFKFIWTQADQQQHVYFLGLGPDTEQQVQLGTTIIRLKDVHQLTSPEDQPSSPKILAVLESQTRQPDDSPLDELAGVRLTSLYDSRLGVMEFEFLNGKISLIEDRNRCRIDQFGDRSACTKKAVLRTEIDLVLESFRNKKFRYRIRQAEGLWFVADRSTQPASYRLVLRNDKTNSRTVKALIPVQRIKMISTDAP
jgi:hypothetical protein